VWVVELINPGARFKLSYRLQLTHFSKEFGIEAHLGAIDDLQISIWHILSFMML
jgi:hypothetical protein